MLSSMHCEQDRGFLKHKLCHVIYLLTLIIFTYKALQLLDPVGHSNLISSTMVTFRFMVIPSSLQYESLHNIIFLPETLSFLPFHPSIPSDLWRNVISKRSSLNYSSRIGWLWISLVYLNIYHLNHWNFFLFWWHLSYG